MLQPTLRRVGDQGDAGVEDSELLGSDLLVMSLYHVLGV